MKEPHMDAERLAALLDGRLNERERAEVLERLASSDEAFEAYVDAVVATRELEAEDEAAGVVPLRPVRGRPWWKRPGAQWLALAAVLAALALAPWLWTRLAAPGLDDPGGFVALLEAEDAGLPTGWEKRPWGSTRAAGDPLTLDARAVRLGALVVDLEVAVRAGDPAAAVLAGSVAALLEGVPAAGPVAAVYREVARRAGEPAEALEPLLEQGREAVARVAGEEMVALGAWAEAARIAAARRDAEFFRTRETRATLERLEELSDSDPPARAAVERIRSALSAEGAPEWGALEGGVEGLLGAVAS